MDTRIVTHLFCGDRSFCGDQNWVPKTTLPLNDLFWPETYSTVQKSDVLTMPCCVKDTQQSPQWTKNLGKKLFFFQCFSAQSCSLRWLKTGHVVCFRKTLFSSEYTRMLDAADTQTT